MPARRKPRTIRPYARYEAAGTTRRMASWTPPSTGPARVVEPGFEKLRARSQDAVRNDWSATSSIQKWGTTLIGVGIVPRWARPEYTAIWREFEAQADADGTSTVYGMQLLGTTSALSAGEVFLRRRPRDLTAPLPLPVQFQLIEGAQVPMFNAITWPGMPSGNTIVQGIERNRHGRRTAVWMYRNHPGETPMGTATPDQLVRVPMSEVSHVFEIGRPGQMRGVSSMAPVLARLRSSGDFESAVLDRQLLANLFVAFLRRQLPQDWKDVEFDSVTGLPKFYDAAGTPVRKLEPGLMQELLPGEDVAFANPPEAGVSYPDYMRSNGLGTAAAQGIPYEFHTGDIRDVSDRVLRLVMQEFRRYAEQRQWVTFIPKLCQPMVQWVGEAAVLAGKLKLSELAEFVSPTWSPHGWDYIHPLQDAQADEIRLRTGVISRDAIISRRGDDPDEVKAQIAADPPFPPATIRQTEDGP